MDHRALYNYFKRLFCSHTTCRLKDVEDIVGSPNRYTESLSNFSVAQSHCNSLPHHPPSQIIRIRFGPCRLSWHDRAHNDLHIQTSNRDVFARHFVRMLTEIQRSKGNEICSTVLTLCLCAHAHRKKSHVTNYMDLGEHSQPPLFGTTCDFIE